MKNNILSKIIKSSYFSLGSNQMSNIKSVTKIAKRNNYINNNNNQNSSNNKYNNNNGNNSNNNSSYFKPQRNVDDLLDDMLKSKGQKEYYNNNNNQAGNSYSSNNTSSMINKKRNKLAFLRDGMIVSFSSSGRKEYTQPGQKAISGYVYVELKEFTEDLFQGNQNKNIEKEQRFIVINQIHLSKFLLLDPRSYFDKSKKDLIVFTQKFRNMTINQTDDNKYTLAMEIFPKVDEITGEVSKEEKIMSQIELNPEDIALLKVYIESWLKDLLNI